MESSGDMAADFIHLRVHSAYSLSEGAIKIEKLIALCRQRGMPAVAVTDSGNLFGALEFASAAAKAGVQPIVGCQIALRREAGGGGAGEARSGARPQADPLVLLVKDETGYHNLLRLVSRAFLESDPGETADVSMEMLAAHGEGLIALTGGAAGPLGALLAERRPPAAEACLTRLAQIFEQRLYIELQRHGMEEETAVEEALIELAYRHELPLVATNDVFFADEGLFEAHDALLCIAEGAYVGQTDRRRLTPEHRFKSAEEMRALFADLPEALDNTAVIARRCAFFPEARSPILPAFPTREGRSEAEELRAQAAAGLETRLAAGVYGPEMDEAARAQAARPYRERLDYELDVIEQMGFPGYFLIVADFIQWANGQGIPVGPGRGSGAGSVVAWSLTITGLDPLRWGLLFERFLNPDRVSMPDFDVDFCQERRDEVLRYVQDKYGHDRVAQIITFGKLQARAVIRDVGRVLQMPYPQVDRICKLIPNNPANPVSLQQAIDGEPQLQDMRRDDETVEKLVDIALKLEGLYRHASTHAAGVVIGDRALDELIPLYRDPRSDMPVTQFSMKYVESAGLVKFDFLGLKTLSILARARDLIRRHQPDFDLERLPLDDQGTFQMIGRGETVGIFQLEGSGMRDMLRRMRPTRFEEIIAVVALYRPGPMDNIPLYLARRAGEEAIDYLYPTLEGILKETFGVMIYQEQVMQIAQELAGYSLGQADLLRRAMGKKIKEEMEAQRRSFVDGAVARGVPKAKADHIFELVNKFAGYGFNKSHAAAYALVAYQTAYLKANHPVEFLAASMTFDLGNTDKLNVFRQELQRLSIPLLPPDVNRSGASFEVEALINGAGEGSGIRYALGAVKNVGEAAMKGLVEERAAEGPFADLGDLVGRLDGATINKRQVEALACAGAFDSLEPDRRRVFEGAETIVRAAQAAASDRDSQQVSLFGGEVELAKIRLPLPEGPSWDELLRLQHEFDAIGFYLSAHPLDAYRATLERLGVVPSTAIGELKAGATATLAGIVAGRQERTSRQGNRFAFVTFSDTRGLYEVVLFTEVLNRCRELLDKGEPLLVTVQPRGEGNGNGSGGGGGSGELRLIAQDIAPLDEAVSRSALNLTVFLKDPEPIGSIRGILDREASGPGGRGRVAFVLGLADGREAEMTLPGRFRLSAGLFRAIKAVPGVTLQDR